MNKKNQKGFTLVELLVVCFIIGLLTLVSLSSFSTAKKRERAGRRVTHIKQVQNALEYYFAVNHSYPDTSSNFRSQCAGWGGYSANNVIPGLLPVYMPTFPADPQMDTVGNLNCYIYKSNGTDYAFIDYSVTELGVSNSAPNYNTYPELIDPARDGGADSSIVDGSNPTAWKVSSPGGRSF